MPRKPWSINRPQSIILTFCRDGYWAWICDLISAWMIIRSGLLLSPLEYLHPLQTLFVKRIMFPNLSAECPIFSSDIFSTYKVRKLKIKIEAAKKLLMRTPYYDKKTGGMYRWGLSNSISAIMHDLNSAGPSPEISCQINQTLITLFGGSGTDFLTYTLLTFKKGEVVLDWQPDDGSK